DVGFDFLGAGNWLGLDAIFNGKQKTWNYTATIMSRTETLEISVPQVRTDPELIELISRQFPHFSAADDEPPEPPIDKRVMAAAAQKTSTGISRSPNLLVM